MLAPAPSSLPASEPPPMLGGTILLVDDDQPNLDVLRAFLEGDGLILEATSGDAALELLDVASLDVIVTDQRMPGLSGVELLRIARERSPDVAGIVLSAYSDTPALLAAINEASAFRYLRKPWTPDDLLRAVADARSHVSQRRTIRQLVSALQERNDELSSTLAELSSTLAELRETRTQLMQLERLAITGRLAAGIAHDLRNAMNGLVLIDMEAQQRSLDPDLVEVLTLGLAGLRDLLTSLDTLGSFARQNRLSLSVEQVDPVAVLRDALGVMKLDMSFRRRQLRQHLPEGLPAILGDRHKLVQAVVNLLRNAVQATTEGQVVEVSAHLDEEGFAVLCVRDEGPGLSDEVRGNLFQAFVSTKGEGGMGLGLYMANLVVGHHQGTLSAAPGSPTGTRFVLRLPTVLRGVPSNSEHLESR